jgi:hypothetical protein
MKVDYKELRNPVVTELGPFSSTCLCEVKFFGNEFIEN